MPSEEKPGIEKLADTERIIRALEILLEESKDRDLGKVSTRLQECITKCQGDYFRTHRQVYRNHGPQKGPRNGGH